MEGPKAFQPNGNEHNYRVLPTSVDRRILTDLIWGGGGAIQIHLSVRLPALSLRAPAHTCKHTSNLCEPMQYHGSTLPPSTCVLVYLCIGVLV